MYPIHYSKANISEIQIVLGILHLSENLSSVDAYIEVKVDCLLARMPDGGICWLFKVQHTSACHQILTEASVNTPSDDSHITVLKLFFMAFIQSKVIENLILCIYKNVLTVEPERRLNCENI